MNKILRVGCGNQHSVALTSNGRVLTWGQKQFGALGRNGGENYPSEVESIRFPMTEIVAGESHTIAYNPSLNRAYFWGTFQVIFSIFHLTFRTTFSKVLLRLTTIQLKSVRLSYLLLILRR
jgi:alpha-tubulin suppressor-like RCC1 family protein